MMIREADPQTCFRDELARVGKTIAPLRPDPHVIGRTTFDGPGSEDMTLTVLLAKDRVKVAPSQSLLRIVSSDERRYLGIVDAGPLVALFLQNKPCTVALVADENRFKDCLKA